MAVSGGSNVVYKPGSIISLAASAAVDDGDLVEVTGNKTVGPAGAASRKVVGRAMQAAGAANDVIPVQIFGYVAKLKASGAIAAGDEVNAGAGGTVAALAAAATAVAADINNARSVIGVALEAIADTASGWVLVGKS